MSRGRVKGPQSPENRSETPSGARNVVRRGNSLREGDRVRVERDETKYPSRNTWKWYNGKTGTITVVNRDPRPGLTEYGVTFGSTRERVNGSLDGGMPTWFRKHELTRLKETS